MPFSDLRGRICSRNTLHYWLWGDWEWNRAFLAQQETWSHWSAAKPTCPPAGQAGRDFCFPGLCGPDGAHSAALLMCTVRSLAHSAQTLTFAALPRLVPLSLCTADPACQLWDKVDDLARLPLSSLLCGSLALSGLCFTFEIIPPFKGKKKGFEIEYWSKLSNKSLAIIVFISLREISSVWLPKNKPLIQNMNACIFFLLSGRCKYPRWNLR